jgi:flagellin-like hook-associated protein FlgL
MPTTYFKNLNTVLYGFGDFEGLNFFNDLTQTVAVVDAINNATTYNKYTILSGDRPDILSFKFYGTVDYYWTFFLVNSHIRESGWPIPTYDLLDETKSKYPYRTIVTNDDISKNFPVGQTVTSNNGTTGTVIRKIPEMGQLIVDNGEEINTTAFGPVGETVSYTDGENVIITATILAESAQYNSIHHYENSDKEYVDLTLFDFNNPAASLTPITYRERLELKNEELKSIIVINPDLIQGVVAEYKMLMRKR